MESLEKQTLKALVLLQLSYCLLLRNCSGTEQEKKDASGVRSRLERP